MRKSRFIFEYYGDKDFDMKQKLRETIDDIIKFDLYL